MREQDRYPTRVEGLVLGQSRNGQSKASPKGDAGKEGDMMGQLCEYPGCMYYGTVHEHAPKSIDTLKWEGRWLAEDGRIACGKAHITGAANGMYWNPITQEQVDTWYQEMTEDLMHPESGIQQDADEHGMLLADFVEVMAAIRCDECGERLETNE